MRPLPFPGVTGPSRRARWRRHVLRRLLAATFASTAVLLVITQVRPPAPSTSPVLVVRREVAPGSVLAPTDLRVEHTPSGALPPGALTDTADAVGRRVGSGLAEGETLTRTRLVPRSASEGLAPSRTALHVLAADPASMSLLHVGQRVVVYGPAGGPALTPRAEVLAIDPERGGDPFVAGELAARGVVLAVDSADVQGLLATDPAVGGPSVVHVVGVG